MPENESAEVAGVPEHVLDELAQTLADKLDILLDRLTDRALTVPDAGTAAWRKQWLDRDSDTGRRDRARRLHVRAVLVRRAGIGLQDAAPPVPAVPTAGSASRQRPSRRQADSSQLTMF